MMNSPLLALNAFFGYNSLLARSLLLLCPREERVLGRAWLHYLSTIPNSSTDELAKRNHYIWFLLLVLQKGGDLSPPFCDLPPCHDSLPDLQDFIPNNVYEEVLEASDKDIEWMREALEEDTEWKPPPIPPPHLFLKYQPMPKEGTFCYMAAFSDPNF